MLKYIEMTNPNPSPEPGQEPKAEAPRAIVNYQLRSHLMLRDYHAGKIYKSQICDAHPELMHAAKGVGEPVGKACPVCTNAELVYVRYVFGNRLGSSGRCMADQADLERIRLRRKGLFTCYVVEVCRSCAWNHLVKSYSFLGLGQNPAK